MIEFNGKTYETDKHEYLANIDDWNEELALHIAELESIDMTPAHWEVAILYKTFSEDSITIRLCVFLLKP